MKIKNLKKIKFFLILLSLSYIYTQDSISTRNDPPELNFISKKELKNVKYQKVTLEEYFMKD